MKVLIAYDGSACARAALQDLHRAGLPREAEVLVISVAERWLSHLSVMSHSLAVGSAAGGVAPARVAADAEAAYKLACGAKSRLEAHFSGWTIDTVAAAGSPAQEIISTANQWEPDLIVLGCHGNSALGRFLLGSVSQKVLHDARCSVRISRGTGWKCGAPVRILIGVDGSPSADEAVGTVANRVWPVDSEVRLVTVIDPPGYNESKPLNQVRDDSWVRSFVDRAEKRLQAVALRVSSKIEIGNPKCILLEVAEEWGADCIILGATASPSATPGLGGVATAVVSRADCSVEIIRMHPGKNDSKPPGGT